MQDLIAKLEAASEGSGELDVDVAKIIGEAPTDAYYHSVSPDDGTNHWRTPRADMEDQLLHERGALTSRLARRARRRECGTENESGLGWVVDYTTSLDAALTLMPEEFAVENAMIWPGKPSHFVIIGTHEFCGERWHNGKDGRWSGEGATAALALTIAALKVRAS